MAKQYEQFKKDFEAIQKGLETGEQAVSSEKTTRQKLDGLVKEHGKEIGRRVRVLRTQGTRGDTIDDFKDDTQVKSLLVEANKHFTQMETQNTRLKNLATGEWKKLSTARATLEKELTTEIAARKKALSTKMGTGNKSLPDMEKLLVEAKGLTKRFNTLAVYGTGTAGLQKMALYRQTLDDTIKEELAKSKDEGLSSDEAELMESTLADRNLRIALATAQSIAQKVKKAVEEALTAQRAKQAEDYKTARATATAELTRLDELVTKRRKAYDTIGDAQIQATKTGPKIKQTILALEALKTDAQTEMDKLPKS
jgi:hypothetical protein